MYKNEFKPKPTDYSSQKNLTQFQNRSKKLRKDCRQVIH